MTNLKSHHSPTSATALHRAYIYLPAIPLTFQLKPSLAA